MYALPWPITRAILHQEWFPTDSRTSPRLATGSPTCHSLCPSFYRDSAATFDIHMILLCCHQSHCHISRETPRRLTVVQAKSSVTPRTLATAFTQAVLTILRISQLHSLSEMLDIAHFSVLRKQHDSSGILYSCEARWPVVVDVGILQKPQFVASMSSLPIHLNPPRLPRLRACLNSADSSPSTSHPLPFTLLRPRQLQLHLRERLPVCELLPVGEGGSMKGIRRKMTFEDESSSSSSFDRIAMSLSL